jgi:hypothetical protein
MNHIDWQWYRALLGTIIMIIGIIGYGLIMSYTKTFSILQLLIIICEYSNVKNQRKIGFY